MGDINAKVGKAKHEKIVGDYGLGNRNERGDRLINFCQEQNLCILITYFKHPPRREHLEKPWWRQKKSNKLHHVKETI